ncbi:hypothetical protein E2C01_037775 [Portunus trituberculatus]|uniref:Endonuclease/exonuclease/phosphatase domain-containing protein n=1 Tax=Portunus trituberculatus TaxID=210409 RepID=A0A5B7FA84_PORTR|nr:hypothetical protein [Portunus trituberculatus]
MLWLRINSQPLTKLICAFFVSSNSSDYSKFFDYLTSKEEHTLSLYPFEDISIPGDFNVYHQLWLSSPSADHPAELAFSFAIIHDLEQLVRSKLCPWYRLDGTGRTSHASLAARSPAEFTGPKTTPSVTSRSVGVGGPVPLANRLALLSDDLVESSERCDGNPPDLTKVTHVVDVNFPPVSPKPLKGLIN